MMVVELRVWLLILYEMKSKTSESMKSFVMEKNVASVSSTLRVIIKWLLDFIKDSFHMSQFDNVEKIFDHFKL